MTQTFQLVHEFVDDWGWHTSIEGIFNSLDLAFAAERSTAWDPYGFYYVVEREGSECVKTYYC